MKKILSFAIIAFFSYESLAQDYHFWQRYRAISNEMWTLDLPVKDDQKREYLAQNGIKSISSQNYSSNKKGEKEFSKLSSTFYFNDSGELMKLEKYKNNHLKSAILYTYSKNHSVTSKTILDHKNREKYAFTHNMTNGASTYIEQKKGKEKVKIIRTAIDTIELTSKDEYYKNGRLKYVWNNEYNANKSLKRSTYLKGNGKVLYVWDYQCNPEGQEIKKHKDTTVICSEVIENKDGTTTSYSHQTDENGEIVKYVSITNAQNKMLYYKKTKGSEDIVELEFTYKYLEDGLTLVESIYNYNRFRNKTVTYIKKYDTQGNIVHYEVITKKQENIEKHRQMSFQQLEKERKVLVTNHNVLENKKTYTLYSYL